MPGTTTTTVSELFVDTYSNVITDSLTRKGVSDANGFVNPKSLLGLLRDFGRVMIAGEAGDEFLGTKNAYQSKHQFASGNSGGSFVEGDNFKTAGDDSYDTVDVGWRSNWEPVEVSGETLDTAKGESIVGAESSVWRRRFENGLNDLFDNIETQLLSDGTGNSGADIDGILSFLKQSGSYGGINMGTYSWWRPFLKDASSAGLSIAFMRLVKYAMNARKAPWDVVLTSEFQTDAYRDLMGTKIRTINIMQGDIETQVPVFDGRPVIPVEGWPDDNMTFISWRNLAYRILPPVQDSQVPNVQRSAFKGMPLRLRYVQPDRDSDALQIIQRSNLICRNPFKVGYIDALATS